MACRLAALDKQPGVRPLGIGEVFRRLWAKCVLRACGSQATAACGSLNLCAGLPAGIEGAVHAVRQTFCSEATAPPAAMPTDLSPEPPDIILRDEVETPPPSGLLLVDAKNGFNELA